MFDGTPAELTPRPMREIYQIDGDECGRAGGRHRPPPGWIEPCSRRRSRVASCRRRFNITERVNMTCSTSIQLVASRAAFSRAVATSVRRPPIGGKSIKVMKLGSVTVETPGRDHHALQAVRRIPGEEARREGRGLHRLRLCRHRAGAFRRPDSSRPDGRRGLCSGLHRQQRRHRAAGHERRAERRQGLSLGADRARGQPLQDARRPQGQDAWPGPIRTRLRAIWCRTRRCATPASTRRSISDAPCSPAGTSRACSVCSKAISTARSPGRRPAISPVSSAS